VGGLFQASQVFGQLAALAVSGNVAPTDFACPAGGTATVSGNVQAGGTYTPGDELTAVFMACANANGQDVTDGQVDVTVTSYSQQTGGAYDFTGDATQSRTWAEIQ
jgi:hypothetical protein